MCLALPGTPRENRYSLSDERAFGITNLDEVVDTIRGALKARSRLIRISITLQGEYMDDIDPLIGELMDLAYRPTGEPDEGDYLRYQTGGYSYSYGHTPSGSGFLYTIEIVPEYFTTPSEEAAVDAAVEEIIASLQLPEDASEYERVRSVYDYLAQNVSYDAVHRDNQYYKLKNTAYGALVRHSAVCQGYAVAMYRLLMELGVENRVIIGQGISGQTSEIHAWNAVRIGDEWYYADPTWNYTVSEEDYFLKGAEDFPNHVPDEEYAGLYDIAERGYDISGAGEEAPR